jgi:hypothetical protein
LHQQGAVEALKEAANGTLGNTLLNLSVAHSALGNEAGLIGGMISGIEQVLSPRGIQYLTRPAGSTMLPLGLQIGA